jgi:hypothetical protein
LETHESFDKGGFAGGLMTNYNDGGGIKRFLEVLMKGNNHVEKENVS